jgi:hypothetical protein
MSAIIERQAGDVLMNQLHITVFALNRMLLSEGRSNWGPTRVNKEAREQWHTAEKKTRRINYFPNGTRDKFSNINCQITNAVGEVPYITSGRFVPNALSLDDSFNQKIDIFRCDMRDIVPNYAHLITSNQSVQVHLLRPLRSGRVSSLLNFSIPWRTRRVGYMQQSAELTFQPSSPSSSGSKSADNSFIRERQASQALLTTKESLLFTKWEPWEHYLDSLDASDHASTVPSPQPQIYLCLSGKTTSPFVDSVALLLEFIQHHLLLGVQHLFLSVRYAWDSQNMHSLLLALRYFIEQKRVTVSSQASDGYDRTASTKGIAW